jgi:hypothetical protein
LKFVVLDALALVFFKVLFKLSDGVRVARVESITPVVLEVPTRF